MMDWTDERWGAAHWGATGWLTMTLMRVFWVVVIGVAIWAAVHLLRRESSSKPPAVVPPTPRATLDHRLASGEIDAEQYAQLRRLLEGQSTGAPPSSTDARS